MCGTATWWAKLALVCALLAVPLHIGGFASDNWMTYESSEAGLELDVGLWNQKNCTGGRCSTSSVHSDYVTGEFNAVRGLETVVTLVVIVVAILLIIYVCVDEARVFNFCIVIMVLCFIGGLASLVGTFLWVASVPSIFVTSYSMGLTVLACLLLLLAGSLLFPDLLDTHQRFPDSRAVTPYTPHDRRTVITPLSYRSGGHSFKY